MTAETAKSWQLGCRFPLGRLKVAGIGAFTALVPAGPEDAVRRFAGDCVTAFNSFREPLSAQDRERRLAARLSPRQVELLERWGYPYVFSEFRFHMRRSTIGFDRLLDLDESVRWTGEDNYPPRWRAAHISDLSVPPVGRLHELHKPSLVLSRKSKTASVGGLVSLRPLFK